LILRKIDPEYWFHTQRGLLEGFGLPELAGYDGEPINIISPIDKSLSPHEVIDAIYDVTVDLLETQIMRGGPTLFLDVAQFQKSAASRLISLIVKERRKEIENTRILIHGSKVLLRPLWFTAYGVDILRALEFSLETDLHGLAQVEASLRKVGLEVKTEDIEEAIELERPSISKSMENYILSIARSMKPEIDVVRRKYWTSD